LDWELNLRFNSMAENKPKFVKVGDAIYLDPEGKQGNKNNQKTQQEQKPPAFSVKGIGEPEKEAPISGAGGYFSSQVSVKDIVPIDIKSLPAIVQQSIRRVLQYPEGTDIDPRQIRALTPSDEITVYGSQAQKLLQRVATYDLIVQLRNAGVEIDPRDIRTLTSSDIVTIANQIARDADSHGQVDVLTYPGPSSGQLPSALTAGGNLKTAILEALPAGTNKIGSVDIASALPAGTNKIGSVDIASALPAGTNNIGKVDVNSLPSLPAGTNTIGSVNIASALPAGSNTIGNVNAIKSGTWNIDNLLNPHPVSVNRQGAITHFSVALSAAGSSTIYTPSSGKAAKVIAWSFYSDADVVVEMRFGTSGKVIAGLPAKGAHAMNLIGTEAPIGAANETIVIYGSGAVNVKGWVSIVEV
jgi:hypothetical protein